MNDELRLSVVQMASGSDVQANLERVRTHLAAVAGRSDLAVFPENVLSLGSQATVRAAVAPEEAWLERLGPLVAEFAVPTVFGGVPVGVGDAVMNRALVLAADGSLLARYDKIHLFRFSPRAGRVVDERRLYTAGTAPATVDLLGWRVALSICYDLRFPELYRAVLPVDLILCPAAFTNATGEAHWEVLLRARAIENQCYAAGIGQCGANPDTGLEMHGHSLVVDPWGEVVGRVDGRPEETLTVTLSRGRLAAVRDFLPALAHRRSIPVAP